MILKHIILYISYVNIPVTFFFLLQLLQRLRLRRRRNPRAWAPDVPIVLRQNVPSSPTDVSPTYHLWPRLSLLQYTLATSIHITVLHRAPRPPRRHHKLAAGHVLQFRPEQPISTYAEHTAELASYSSPCFLPFLIISLARPPPIWSPETSSEPSRPVVLRFTATVGLQCRGASPRQSYH